MQAQIQDRSLTRNGLFQRESFLEQHVRPCLSILICTIGTSVNNDRSLSIKGPLNPLISDDRPLWIMRHIQLLSKL